MSTLLLAIVIVSLPAAPTTIGQVDGEAAHDPVDDIAPDTPPPSGVSGVDALAPEKRLKTAALAGVLPLLVVGGATALATSVFLPQMTFRALGIDELSYLFPLEIAGLVLVNGIGLFMTWFVVFTASTAFSAVLGADPLLVFVACLPSVFAVLATAAAVTATGFVVISTFDEGGGGSPITPFFFELLGLTAGAAILGAFAAAPLVPLGLLMVGHAQDLLSVEEPLLPPMKRTEESGFE